MWAELSVVNKTTLGLGTESQTQVWPNGAKLRVIRLSKARHKIFWTLGDIT